MLKPDISNASSRSPMGVEEARSKVLAECDFNLTNGPVNTYPAVLRALSRTVIFDYDPSFKAFYAAVNEKARRAMRLSNQPVLLHGESVLGLEAAAAALIAPDDKVLNLVSGFFSKAFEHYAKRYCAGITEIAVPPDETIDPDAVAKALKADPSLRVVALVHHETPCGTINPINEIGRIVREHGAYLIVDATSSFGGMDVHPEAAQTDIFVTTHHKCLGGAPGLAMVGVSDRAWKKIKANPSAPRGSYISLLDWEEAWRPDLRFPFTPIVSLINSLDAALDLYFDEGPEAVWKRHAVAGRAFQQGVKAMGLELWPAKESALAPMTTTIKLPSGISDTELRAAMHRRYRVHTAAGTGPTAGKILRVGHMAQSAQPLHSVAGVTAVAGGLGMLGHKVDVAAGVAAAVAVIDAA